MNVAVNFEWTDERVKRMQVLRSQGKTAAEIADDLGAVSRNAVIGKLRRIEAQRTARKKAAPSPAPAPQPVKQPAGLPKPLFMKLFELKHDDCRWPVAGEKADTLFCGHNVEPGCSYCPGHKRLSVGHGTQSERNAVPAGFVR